MEVIELITLYISVWNEPDHTLRQQLLEKIWDEDGSYTDPTVHIPNRKEFITHIDRFIEQFPGCHLLLTSQIDTHHNNLRFTWHMVNANAKVLMEGTDFGELSPDGKFYRIVGFFGSLAPKS